MTAVHGLIVMFATPMVILVLTSPKFVSVQIDKLEYRLFKTPQ